MRSIQLVIATLISTSALALLPNRAQAQPRLGAGLIYGTEIEEVGLQVNGYYGLDQVLEGLRLGAEFNYFFVSDPASFWTVDLNGHYRFFKPSELGVYALAGLDIARASVEAGGFEASSTEVGLNLGIGVEYAVVPNFELFGELKYVVGEADQAVFAIGGRYLFL